MPHLSPAGSPVDPGPLRRTVATAAGLNHAYFFVEVAVALAIGSAGRGPGVRPT